MIYFNGVPVVSDPTFEMVPTYDAVKKDEEVKEDSSQENN